MMDAVFIYLLETSICLGITLLIYRLVLSGLTFFAWNRAILLVLMGLSFTIPLMSFDFFEIGGGEVVREFTLPVVQVGDQLSTVESNWSFYMEILLGIYLIGVLISASRLVFGFMVSQRLIGKAKKINFSNNLIAIHPEFVPASFFNYILMPEFDPERPEQKQIILHESIHVRLRHSWDLLLVNFGKVIFWFNPLIYLFEKSLREVHEYQADQGVTRAFSPKEYASLLLRLITARPGFQFMNNFNQFQTKKRILMLTKTNSKPQQKARFLALVPVVSILILVFSCEITPEKDIEGPTQVAKSQGIGPSNLSARITVGAEEIFDVTEEMPVPPGGMEGWSNFLLTNVSYPSEARKKGLEGTVIVVFEIHEDGSVHNPEILRGVSEELDQEALRVVSNSPNWTAGKQKGREVKTRMRLPIQFKLGTVADADFAPRTRQINQKLAQFEWSKGKLKAIQNSGDEC